ncbi:MAG: hypothetical protein WA637_25380 [Terriglobales bacterium]
MIRRWHEFGSIVETAAEAQILLPRRSWLSLTSPLIDGVILSSAMDLA